MTLGTELSGYIAAGDTGAIAAALDSASEPERAAACQALNPEQQKRLWLLASKAPHADSALIPDPAGGATQRFAGRNSLRAFSRFEKRFVRLGTQIFGMNVHPLRPVIGPGYFGVEERAGGRCRFDYTALPVAVPPGWPAVRSNDSGLARAVYGGLVDEVVWVARDVLVGAAFRKGTPLDSYFVLARTS